MVADDSDDTAGQPGDDGALVRADWRSTDRPSTAIIEALAAATGCDPVDVDPLFSTLDLDALDALLEDGRVDGSDVSVSFVHESSSVTVSSDGTIEIAPAE